MFVRASQGGGGGGGGEVEFQAIVKYAGGVVFERNTLQSCMMMIDKVDSASWPLQLVASSYPPTASTDINSWTELRTFASATSSYADILSTVSSSWAYFGFKTASNNQTAMIHLKVS